MSIDEAKNISRSHHDHDAWYERARNTKDILNCNPSKRFRKT